MRDWPRTLGRASYRGVSFFVDDWVQTGGRRLHIHEFVSRDEPFIEDLGERYKQFTVRAYLVGDSADAASASLFEACTAFGAGSLNLPGRQGIQAHCEDVSISFDKTKEGMFPADLKFVLAGSAGGPIAIGIISRAISEALGGLRSAAASAYRTRFANFRVPGPVDSAAHDILEVFAGGIITQIDSVSTTSDPEKSAALRLSATRFNEDVEALVRSGTDEALWEDTDEVVEEPTPIRDGSGLPERAFDLARDFYDAADDKLDAADALATVFDALAYTRPEVLDLTDAEVAALEQVPQVIALRQRTVGRYKEAADATTMSVMLRSAVLGYWSEAISEVQFTDRAQAIRYRALGATMYEELLVEVIDPTLAGVLQHANGKVAEFVSLDVASLNPTVTVTGNRSLPAVFWAHVLYADANRADEIVSRNRVRNPTFMPAEFEALAQ